MSLPPQTAVVEEIPAPAESAAEPSAGELLDAALARDRGERDCLRAEMQEQIDLGGRLRVGVYGILLTTVSITFAFGVGITLARGLGNAGASGAALGVWLLAGACGAGSLLTLLVLEAMLWWMRCMARRNLVNIRPPEARPDD